MAGSGDHFEKGSVDAGSAAESAPLVGGRRRLSSPEAMACSSEVSQQENAQKKLCVHGPSEFAVQQGDLVGGGLPWRCCSGGNNTAGDDDIAAYLEKYNRYQAEYVRRLKAKYFSKKAFNGGKIFDQETNIDGENIKSSRWPCTRSFAEPAHGLQESSALASSAADTTILPGRKHHLKKNNNNV